MRKVKKMHSPLIPVIHAILWLPLIRFWMGNWVYSPLIALAAGYLLWLLTLFIRYKMINKRINQEQANGNLDKWLSGLDLPPASAWRPMDLLKRIIEIRIDPRASERDRNYAAFLTRTWKPIEKNNPIKYQESFDDAKI